MKARRIALGCAMTVSLVAPAAQAQVFKCKDADGKVTYTDVPCLRSEAESVVDTRAASNVADHSSIRKEAGRVQAAPATPPPAPSQSASPPPPPPPGPRNEPRTRSY